MHLAKFLSDKFGLEKLLLSISSILMLLSIGQICLDFFTKKYNLTEFGWTWMSFPIFAMVLVKSLRHPASLISPMIYHIIQVKTLLKHQLFL